MNLIGKGISEIRQLLEKKLVTAQEIVAAHFQYIASTEKDILAFMCLTEELAYKQAKHIDDLIHDGKPLPALAGVPLVVKDNICIPGYPTTCSSKILESFSPSYQASAVSLLFEAGAICLGKTNLDEFAMGSSTENSAFKLTRNPWNTNHVPGGSSGGSAAAVAAAFSTIALGSDTGGSVRQPASFCGVVGMKPTYGMVSRFGLVAFASSLDQIGSFARTVEDTALTLAVMAKHDERDSTSLPDSVRYKNNDLDTLAKNIKNITDLKNVKIGIIEELTSAGNETEVSEAIKAASKTFLQLGATIDTVSIPHAKNALPVYYILATAEASANLARYDGVRYGYRDKSKNDVLSMYLATRQDGFGSEVKRRIMLGTYVLSSGYYDAYYKKAQQVRRLLCDDFQNVFAKYDLVICPTSPSVAFKLGERSDDPLQMYLSDVASIPANLAGLPAISLPCGFGKNNMPIGLQLMGAPLSDARLLQAAYAFEQATKFHQQYPAVLVNALAATKH